MTSPRKIIHIDMDAFYASVELREQPHLRGKPVVVAWDGARSVICAASYEARKYGLRSAMAVATAKRLCPHAVFIPPQFALYRQVSRQIHQIFRLHTDLIEPLALDEAYLDVTCNKQNIAYARDIALAIRAEIHRQTGLTASAGIAPNKFLAKIASDWRKPNGQFVIAPQNVNAFLHTLPLGKISGVGKKTLAKLNAQGWQTVGDLQRVPLGMLITCSAGGATACTTSPAAWTTVPSSPSASACKSPLKSPCPTICRWAKSSVTFPIWRGTWRSRCNAATPSGKRSRSNSKPATFARSPVRKPIRPPCPARKP